MSSSCSRNEPSRRNQHSRAETVTGGRKSMLIDAMKIMMIRMVISFYPQIRDRGFRG